MSFDFFGVLAIFIALVGALIVAARRWGVDSRFIDVRSDF